MWRKISVSDDLDVYFGIRDEVCNLCQGWIVEHVQMLYLEAQHFEENKKCVPCNSSCAEWFIIVSY